VLLDDGLEPRSDTVEGLVPARALEAALALRADAPQGVEDAIGVVDDVGEEAVHLLAQRTPGQGMMGVSFERDRPAAVGGDRPGAAVRAIVHAHPADAAGAPARPADPGRAEDRRGARQARVDELAPGYPTRKHYSVPMSQM
jgi:hypothetical protein